MAQIGNIPDILDVKHRLENLQAKELIEAWELPCENLLTRLSAALFFLSPKSEECLEEIWKELNDIPLFKYEKNADKTLSTLDWKVEFSA